MIIPDPDDPWKKNNKATLNAETLTYPRIRKQNLAINENFK